MQTLRAEKKTEIYLEGLRGIAAFAVVFGHICYFSNYLDPNYSIKLYGNYVPPGHFSVLVFFCLSGFVIGYTNPKPLAGRESIWNYIKKRFIRIYPIYFISILIVLPYSFHFNKHEVLLLLKHLTFTNIFFGEIYPQNNPLWSLNYEMLYYIIFIPLSYFSFPRGWAIIVSLLIAVVNAKMNTPFNHPLITSYSIGLAFWLTGAKLSEMTSKKNVAEAKTGLILSSFLLTLALPHFVNYSGFAGILSFLEVNNNVPGAFKSITFGDLLMLGFCVYFILILTNAKFRLRTASIIFVYLFPLAVIARFLFKGAPLATLAIPSVIYALSVALLLSDRIMNDLNKRILHVFEYSGSISYAIYATHMPLLLLIGSVNFFSGSLTSALVRLLVFLIILIGAGIVLEKYFQPFIKKKLEMEFDKLLKK